MFSYFFPTVTKTRFESTALLSELKTFLKQLHDKEKELKGNLGTTPSSDSCMKSYVVSSLVAEIDKTIAKFNETPAPKSSGLEILSIALLVETMNRLISFASKKYADILNAKLSSTKAVVSTAVNVSTTAATVAVGVATGSLLYTAGAWMLGAPALNYGVKKATGLDDDRSATMQLLDNFSKKLGQIITPLSTVLNTVAYTPDAKQIIPLVCPITKENIKMAVECSLDSRHHVYEKSAIKTYLKEHKTTPFGKGHIPMKDTQTPDDVLTENISLRDALWGYMEMQGEFDFVINCKEEEALASALLRKTG